MSTPAVQISATPPRRGRMAVAHAVTAWLALVWMLACCAALGLALLAKVSVCAQDAPLQGIAGRFCDFRIPGWAALGVGFMIALALILFLAEDESEHFESPVPLRRRIHSAPMHAYRALKRRDTPHRRKSIGSFGVFIALVIVFYIIVSLSHIAFAGAL